MERLLNRSHFIAPGGIRTTSHGQLADGREVTLFTLENAAGMQVSISPYGGIVTSLIVPDCRGRRDDVVLGFSNLQAYTSREYHDASPYFGALIGRYGNRIAGGSFIIDGTRFALATNEGGNTLHGGVDGFERRLWEARPFREGTGVGLSLILESADGDQGFPGRLSIEVRYTLLAENTLDIRYQAVTTKATHVNLTHHGYFNLEGEGEGNVLDHLLMINADAFLPIDDALLPVGDLRSVTDTPFDFRQPISIGARIETDDRQLLQANGYDHNFVVTQGNEDSETLTLAAVLEAPRCGRVMKVYTTEPGIQLYSGNSLDGSLIGKSGNAYSRYAGVALETQHFPDSPHHPSFPSTLLKPGERYTSNTQYQFSTRADLGLAGVSERA